MPEDFPFQAWRRPSVRISPFFPAAACAVAIAKASYLAHGASIVSRLNLGMEVFYNDFSFLSLFFVALFLQCSGSSPIQLLTLLFSTTLLFWYSLDTLVIFILNHRVNLLDFITYSTNLPDINEIKFIALAFLGYLTLVVYSQRFLLSVQPERVAGAALFLIILPTFRLDFSLGAADGVAADNLRVRKMLIGDLTEGFTPEEIMRLRGDSRPPATILPKYRSVILLLVESLSACDSFRTSGLFNHFPRMDELSRDGTLFVEFIANGSYTEAGLVSLFSGSPPLVFPGFPYSLSRAYANQDSLLRLISQNGYRTAFLSSASLAFRLKGELVSNLGFQKVMGLDEVPSFKNAEKFSLGAVADEKLYDKALSILDNNAAHLFLTVETASSHLPYLDPLHRANDEKHVLDYVDEQIARFYGELQKRGFFDHGLLIITGDHRKMLPVSAAERKIYGVTAEMRVPLILIGKGIAPKEVDHRLVQQSDLLKLVFNWSDNGWPISAAAYYVEDYTAPIIGSNPSLVRVLLPSGAAYSVSILGKSLSWSGNSAPAESRLIELDLHRRLARLQYCHQNTPACRSSPETAALEEGR